MTVVPIISYANEFIQPSDDQVAGWRAVVPPRGGLPELIGDCPHCLHECDMGVTDVVARGGVPAAAQSEPVAVMTRQLICNCRSDHQQPAGVAAGCGRYWLGTLTRLGDGSFALSVERDLGLLPAASALNHVLASQDARIQAAAEKWLGAVTALYGLFSLTGVATARGALDGLDTASRWAVASAMLVGVTLAAVALVFGYRAAYGWPGMTTVATNADLAKWHESQRSYVSDAIRHLRTAVVCACGSLAAVSVVMLLVWFLPRQAV